MFCVCWLGDGHSPHLKTSEGPNCTVTSGTPVFPLSTGVDGDLNGWDMNGKWLVWMCQTYCTWAYVYIADLQWQHAFCCWKLGMIETYILDVKLLHWIMLMGKWKCAESREYFSLLSLIIVCRYYSCSCFILLWVRNNSGIGLLQGNSRLWAEVHLTSIWTSN